MQTRQRLVGGTFISAFISSVSASSKDSNKRLLSKKNTDVVWRREGGQLITFEVGGRDGKYGTN